MTMASLAQEEYELMKDSKYRVYVTAVDKVLKNFEYTSEWADLISALGKLNKVLITHTKFPVIPRRITISKRLAQCMHPALPSGVHLKALETYDAIFKCMGTNRLAHELFIYSAGLFPLLGHAAMNVRLLLLTVYETHFVPLGERLRPALSGFLSGVLPGLESGSDHYDSTNSLLEKVCDGVGAVHFYTCLWEILACNSATRLPAISFVLDHFNRKVTMSDQMHLIGKDSNIMVSGLCACMCDQSVLVQRSALELLLVGLPLHLPLLAKNDLVRLIVAGLSTLLRRDMSLNRRLYSWLLGTEVNLSEVTIVDQDENSNPYFEMYSRDLLVQAIRIVLSNSASEPKPDLKPYRLLMSLLDKTEIGPVILDDILLDLFRTLYETCKDNQCCDEILKSSNMLLSSLEPFYIWDYSRSLFAKCCQIKSVDPSVTQNGDTCSVHTDILELCTLLEYLLDTLPLETYVDTISEHLPKLFVKLTELLIKHLDLLSIEEISSSLSLMTKIVARIQTMVVTTETPIDLDEVSTRLSTSMHEINLERSPNETQEICLEKSKSDSKLNNSMDSGSTDQSPKKSPRKLFRKKKQSNKMKSLDSLNAAVSSNDETTSEEKTSPVRGVSRGFVSHDTTKPAEKQNLLEKCISSYQDLFVNFIAVRVLNFSNKTKRVKINELFDILLNDGNKIYDADVSVKTLEKILSNSLDISKITKCSRRDFESNLADLKLFQTKADGKLIDTIKLSCRLLVELSSFPTYSQNENAQSHGHHVSGFNDDKHQDSSGNRQLTEWLKVLSLCACLFKSEPEVQMCAISTLLDLTSLLKTQLETRESSVGVTAVVVIPLMRKWHIEYLEKNTRIFQILAYSLWNHLGQLPSTDAADKSNNRATSIASESESYLSYKNPSETIFKNDRKADRMRNDSEGSEIGLNSVERTDRNTRMLLCAQLLHQLHDCVCPGNSPAEKVIGESMGPDRSNGQRLESFQRFATLWHLGRNTSASGSGKPMRTFDKALLKMLDNLQLPESSSLKLYSASWVTQSLLRGDLHRLLDPILFILLDPLTSRMSILHVSIRHSNTRLTNKADSEYGEQTDHNSQDPRSNSKVYAISSVDGNVIYHVSDDSDKNKTSKSFTRKIMSPLMRNNKFYSLKDKSVKKGNVIGKHYTVNDVPENGLAVSPQQICLFVNPFSATDSCSDSNLEMSAQDELKSKLTNTSTDQTSSESTSFADDFYDAYALHQDDGIIDTLHRSKSVSGSSSERSSEVTGMTTSKSAEDVSDKTKSTTSKLSGILNPVNLSDGLIEHLESTMNEIKDGAPDICDAPVPADEYFEPSEDKASKKKKKQHRCYDNGYLAKGVHQLHSHMLLYSEVYDSNRTIYALQTLRNEILANPRVFLCSAATTGISNVPKGAHLLTLLARHKKSIYGHSFYGPIANTEYIYSYRNCMYLEILITVSLHFARSYYPNLGNVKLTPEELCGNQKVQLASVELLMLICTQLISIVKDSGKGFASYIGDLLSKCKVHKIVLHCVISSVYFMKMVNDGETDITFTEEIMSFNDPDFDEVTTKSRISNHTESFQTQLLHLLQALIVLEYEVNAQKAEDVLPIITSPSSEKESPLSSVKMTSLKYNPSRPITQQPIFLAAILLALQMDCIRHLHQHWTTLLSSSLPYITSNFKIIVISVIHQLCSNIEKISVYYDGSRVNEKDYILPPDYTITQLEALTVLCHYCLLDSSQQTLNVFNHGSQGVNSTNPGQIINNLIHVFMPTPLQHQDGSSQGKGSQHDIHMAARQTVLSHMPRIMAAVARLWEGITSSAKSRLISPRGEIGVVKQQLLELLSPISLHHGVNFLAAVAVAWLDRKTPDERIGLTKGQGKSALPTANTSQRVLVYLVSELRVMPMDVLVKTVHQVVKSPPQVVHDGTAVKGADQSLDVGVLELFYWYMQSASASQLSDIWPSLLGLLREGVQTPLCPAAQFLLLAALNEFAQKCAQMQDKRDQRDLHDITSKLVESVSQVAGACLQQTTWLRRNLAVKQEEDLKTSISSESSQSGSNGQSIDWESGRIQSSSQAQSVQAQLVLGELLATLLDAAFCAQQERVVAILTPLMAHVTPYLRHHAAYNAPAFRACSALLASLSGYQYTRKAWRKDAFDLLMDPSLFQMEKCCLKHWRTIIDNLMTHDNTTFRDFMNRVSMPQSGSLSIFSSREQENEQRALLLRRLAFVIFCSETDQYYKYMPEIQEQMTNNLRLAQAVPAIQANVFLCFRVILLRMSSQHVTSLWPTIISELVQVLLQIEQELVTNTEEFRTNSSSHIKLLSALDNSWVTNANNGLSAHGNPQWLQLQLAAAKLLDLVLVLPAKELPQFQMYRWAFVSDVDLSHMDYVEDDITTSTKNNSTSVSSSNSTSSCVFVPHVCRLARLMDVCYKDQRNSAVDSKMRPGELLLTAQSIKSLRDLHQFFKTLSHAWSTHVAMNNVVEQEQARTLSSSSTLSRYEQKDDGLSESLRDKIESVLEEDFLDRMPD